MDCRLTNTLATSREYEPGSLEVPVHRNVHTVTAKCRATVWTRMQTRGKLTGCQRRLMTQSMDGLSRRGVM